MVVVEPPYVLFPARVDPLDVLASEHVLFVLPPGRERDELLLDPVLPASRAVLAGIAFGVFDLASLRHYVRAELEWFCGGMQTWSVLDCVVRASSRVRSAVIFHYLAPRLSSVTGRLLGLVRAVLGHASFYVLATQSARLLSAVQVMHGLVPVLKEADAAAQLVYEEPSPSSVARTVALLQRALVMAEKVAGSLSYDGYEPGPLYADVAAQAEKIYEAAYLLDESVLAARASTATAAAPLPAEETGGL